MVWIIHISDLHRDPGSPIPNDLLVESIKADIGRIRGSNEPVDVIIVSGDLVQGSNADDLASASAEVEAQYRETRELLKKMVLNLALDDWNRLVIVPGNHDVSWPQSRLSMTERSLPPSGKERREAIKTFRGNSNHRYRWSWDDLAFYEIQDEGAYRDRFEQYSAFFRDLPGNRGAWENKDGRRFTIQTFDEHQLCIVGFCSCNDIDHLNHTGRIHPDAIAAVEEKLREIGANSYLKVAVWHHNTRGGPAESDYMHDHVLEVLTQFGYSAGFHGHQHRSEVVYRHSAVDNTDTLAVFSAASLCAGARALPPGHNRGYNIVRFDPEQATVWARETLVLSDYPAWTARHVSASVSGMLHVPLRPPPKKPELQPIRQRVTALLDAGDDEAALTVIETANALNDTILRANWFDTASRTEDFARLAKAVPTGTQEALLVLEAIEGLGNGEVIESRLREEWTRSDDPSVRELVKRLSARQRARRGINE